MCYKCPGCRCGVLVIIVMSVTHVILALRVRLVLCGIVVISHCVSLVIIVVVSVVVCVPIVMCGRVVSVVGMIRVAMLVWIVSCACFVLIDVLALR